MPGGGDSAAGLLFTLLALLVALAAVLLGLLHHFSQSRPDELRQLLAPLAPALQAVAGVQWLPEPAREFLGQLT